MTIDSEPAEALDDGPGIMTQLQSMESIVRLTNGVGHEYNNLMATIMGALQLVQVLNSAGRASETAQVIESAIRAAQGAVAINQRLVRLAGSHAFNPKSLCINDIAGGLVELLRPALSQSLSLDTDFAPDLWQTHGDQHQLELAFLNLVLCTRDVMPDGRRMAIRTRNRVVEEGTAPSRWIAPGRYVCIDLGISFSAKSEDGSPNPPTADQPPKFLAVQRFARQSGGDAKFDRIGGAEISTALYLPGIAGNKT